MNFNYDAISCKFNPTVRREKNAPENNAEVAAPEVLHIEEKAVEASSLDLLSATNKAMVTNSAPAQEKTSWTKEELFYMGFTSLTYFEETSGADGQALYKLKGDVKVNGKEIHSIEELKEALNVYSVDEYIATQEINAQNIGDGHGGYLPLTADSKAFHVTWASGLKSITEVLAHMAEYYKYDDPDLMRYGFDESKAELMGLMQILKIEKGESEDSIRDKVNNYLQQIGMPSGESLDYDSLRASYGDLFAAIYRDSEYFKTYTDKRFAQENEQKTMLNGHVDFERYGTEFSTQTSLYDIKQFYIKSSEDSNYGDENYKAFLKLIEQAAGINSEDKEWYQKMPKIEALFEKIASQLTYANDSSVIDTHAIYNYLADNGYITQRTYTEADVNVFRTNNLNVEDYFDTIQNEDGTISYKMKTDLVGKSHQLKDSPITSMDWLLFDLGQTGYPNMILPSLAPDKIVDPYSGVDENFKTTDYIDVIVVSSAQDLLKIKDNPAAQIVLAADIDMSGIDWTPIGTVDNPFTGKIIGNGFTIKNLTITSNSYNCGFFGVADGAEISDLKFENVNVVSTNTDSLTSTNPLEERTAGVLAGLMKNCNLKNVEIIDSTVDGKDSAGLICGKMIHCDGKNLKVTGGKVNGNYAVGGAVGNSLDTVIETLEVRANVEGGVWTGGIFGAYSGRKFYAGDTLTYYARSTDLDFEGTVTGGSNNLGAGGIYGQTDISLCKNFYAGFEVRYVSYRPESAIVVNGNFAGSYAGYSCELTESGEIKQLLPLTLKGASTVAKGEIGNSTNAVELTTPDEYLATIQANAERMGLKPTPWKGVYYNVQGGTICHYIYDRDYAPQGISGTGEYGVGINNLSDADIGDILAIELGYNFTKYTGVYEKDGKYYKFTNKASDGWFHFDEASKARMFEKFGSGMEEVSLESIIGAANDDGIEASIPPVTTPSDSENSPTAVEVIDVDDALAEMEAAAQKYGLIKSEQTGLYYSYKDSERYAMIWNPVTKRFHSFAIDVKKPDGTVLHEFTSTGKAVKRTIENLYFEALVMAYALGYSPTSKLGVFSKDGKYYEYDPDTSSFTPVD